MFSNIAVAVSLAPLALAAIMKPGSKVIPAGPAVTEPPTLPDHILHARDGITTTYAVSSCYNFADPDQADNPSGCYCSGYSGLMPHITIDSTAGCSWSEFVTTIPTSTNAFPFTTTLSNDAIVAYASSVNQYNYWQGTGDSTVLQFGTKLTLQMDPTASVNIGKATEEAQQSALYTSISNSLVAACPTPTSGETVTTCNEVAAVTGIGYVNEYTDFHEDGNLGMQVPIISVTDGDTLNALIASIAGVIMASATLPGNTAEVSYSWPCSDCWESAIGWPTVNLTNAPALIQSIITKQTADTDGNELLQNMEVLFTLGEGSDPYDCSDLGTALSGLSALGGILALIPGMEWAGALGLGLLGSEMRFAVSMTCNLEG